MKWEYSVQMMAPFYGTVKGKAVKRVDKVENIKGKKYFKLVTVFSEIPGMENDVEYLRKAEDGIFYISEKRMDSPEAIMIPFPIEVGKTWTSKYPIEDELIDIKSSIVGFETLELIDKKYDNCLKILRKGRYQLMNFESIDYRVKNIGIVKGIIKMNGISMEINLDKFSR
ncbi:MAG: hypothetical protein HQ555_11720 [Candidatus Aminicenantes bacterium]|nr:hypothetical protein [Candidatus Aminicenantes bacterium]